jgi:hypothetical protein
MGSPRIFLRPTPGCYPAKANCVRKRLSPAPPARGASSPRSLTALIRGAPTVTLPAGIRALPMGSSDPGGVEENRETL